MNSFKWRVSKASYDWNFAYDPDGQVRWNCLTTYVKDEDGWEDSFPLENRSLFLEFIRLDCTASAFLSFANKHGSLTSGVTVTDENGYPVENKAADLLRWPNKEVFNITAQAIPLSFFSSVSSVLCGRQRCAFDGTGR